MVKKRREAIIALDLSTNCSGFAAFKEGKLVDYGVIVPKVAGITKLSYPISSLKKSYDLSVKILEIIEKHNPDCLVVEEINRGKNRISQKTLDGLHFIFYLKLLEIRPDLLDTMTLMDSDGKAGWRTVLGIALTPEDRKYNKTCTKANKKRKITRKDAAQRWVNAFWGKDFDVVADKKHEDVIDAIGLGSAYLKVRGELDG